jgi:hypothetical protein
MKNLHFSLGPPSILAVFSYEDAYSPNEKQENDPLPPWENGLPTPEVRRLKSSFRQLKGLLFHWEITESPSAATDLKDIW